MADDSDRLDLIQRLADKQNAGDKKSLAERAAEKLAATRVKPAAMTVADAASDSRSRPQPSGDSQPKNKVPDNADRETFRFNLDYDQLRRSGYITPDQQQSHLAEEFRAIKRPLLLKAFGNDKRKVERGNVVMITSAQPGEGKTFSSINLAMSIASERDLHVLLIDTDVYRHRLEEELGIGDRKGLVDLLIDDKLELTDLFVRTNIPNLTILPVGTKHPQAPELMASQKMASLMDDIAARYPDRVIIIDSPPVLASSEASVLALLVGQIVLVVEANRTKKANVERSLKLISNCENIYFVINKTGADSTISAYRTYSYYDEYRT
ncbi:MAG: XrtA-associated tyrosine autokinase [Alphaproteobacteria bacterium]